MFKTELISIWRERSTAEETLLYIGSHEAFKGVCGAKRKSDGGKPADNFSRGSIS